MDEFQRKLIREIRDYKYGVVLIFIGLMFIGLCLLCSSANAAESAIVSFDDAEHLVALTDSVVGVCDTTGYKLPDNICIWYPEHFTESQREGVRRKHGTSSLTCRELVCVTVTKDSSITIVEQIERRYLGNVEHYKKVARGEAPPMSTEILTVGSPGQAIINYRRVKQ